MTTRHALGLSSLMAPAALLAGLYGSARLALGQPHAKDVNYRLQALVRAHIISEKDQIPLAR